LLSASELRELFCLTACRPGHVDRSTNGIASEGSNDWDRTGHNFKVGYGTVDALRATLAAIDPVSAAFVLAGRPKIPDAKEPGLALARRWHRAIVELSSPLALEYKQLWAPVFVKVLLNSREALNAMLWFARHLVELATTPSQIWVSLPHPALVQRLLIALWECAEHIERYGSPSDGQKRTATHFAAHVEHAILALHGDTLAQFINNLVSPSEP